MVSSTFNPAVKRVYGPGDTPTFIPQQFSNIPEGNCWLCGRPLKDHKQTVFGPICPKKVI